MTDTAITLSLKDKPGRKKMLYVLRGDEVLTKLSYDPHDLYEQADIQAALMRFDKERDWAADLHSLAARFGKNGADSAVELDASAVAESLERDWPEDADPAAFHGPLGEMARTLAAQSEADVHGILLSLLITFATCIGPGPYIKVGRQRHHLRLFGLLIGDTSVGRKGMAQAEAYAIYSNALAQERASGEDWVLPKRLKWGGMSSGEGVIWQVRDETTKWDAKENRLVTLDPGVEDKRVLFVEEEFGRQLEAMTREKNILSAVIRNAWDTGTLHITTKTPTVATNTHIGIIGHITPNELREKMRSAEIINGLGNRFLLMAVRRSGLLPFGGEVPDRVLDDLGGQFLSAVRFAHGVDEIGLSDDARDWWEAAYEDLSAEKPGVIGSFSARGPAQVRRIAACYAVADHSRVTKPEHFQAAAALWERSLASISYVWGDNTGNLLADRILKALREGESMTGSELYDLAGDNAGASAVARALGVLQKAGLAEVETTATGGRPLNTWKSTR